MSRARSGLFALSLCWLLVCALRAQELSTAESALRRAFPDAERIDERRLTVPAAARERLAPLLRGRRPPRVLRVHVGLQGGRALGYALIDNVLGKNRPITYLLHTDPSLAVRAVEILAYRESHGGEVERAAFRRQFVGARPGETLEVGVNVRNIAGATISCRSLTDGVHDLLLLLEAVDLDALRTTAGAPGAAPAEVEDAARSAPRAAAANTHVRARLAMGTTLTLHLWNPPGADAERLELACDAAFAEVERLEGLLSSWRPSSEISRLNAAAGGGWCALSPDLSAVLERARLLRSATRGAFDPSVGAVVDVWRRAAEAGTGPSAAQLASALANTGLDALRLEPGRGRLTRAGVRLDLGASGKGTALAHAARVLEAHGVRCALLDFGGQLLALDAPPGTPGWPVAVRDPRSAAGAERPPLAELELARASLATSADDQRGVRTAGGLVSHVLDPRTGRPVRGVLSASVLGPDPEECDAWSTACRVLSAAERAEALAERGLALLVLEADGTLVRAPAFRAPAADVEVLK